LHRFDYLRVSPSYHCDHSLQYRKEALSQREVVEINLVRIDFLPSRGILQSDDSANDSLGHDLSENRFPLGLVLAGVVGWVAKESLERSVPGEHEQALLLSWRNFWRVEEGSVDTRLFGREFDLKIGEALVPLLHRNSAGGLGIS